MNTFDTNHHFSRTDKIKKLIAENWPFVYKTDKRYFDRTAITETFGEPATWKNCFWFVFEMGKPLDQRWFLFSSPNELLCKFRTEEDLLLFKMTFF